jgi:hypothetical protein
VKFKPVAMRMRRKEFLIIVSVLDQFVSAASEPQNLEDFARPSGTELETLPQASVREYVRRLGGRSAAVARARRSIAVASPTHASIFNSKSSWSNQRARAARFITDDCSLTFALLIK